MFYQPLWGSTPKRPGERQRGQSTKGLTFKGWGDNLFQPHDFERFLFRFQWGVNPGF